MVIIRNIALILVLFAVVSCGGLQKVVQPTNRYTDIKTGKTFADKKAFLDSIKQEHPRDWTILYELAKEDPEIYDRYAKNFEMVQKQELQPLYFDEKGNEITRDIFHETLAKNGINGDFESVVRNYYEFLMDGKYEQAFKLLDPEGQKAASYKSNFNIFTKEQEALKHSDSRFTDIEITDIKMSMSMGSLGVDVYYKVWGFSIYFPEPITDDKQKPPELPREGKPSLPQPPPRSLHDVIPKWEYVASGISSMSLRNVKSHWLIFIQN